MLRRDFVVGFVLGRRLCRLVVEWQRVARRWHWCWLVEGRGRGGARRGGYLGRPWLFVCVDVSSRCGWIGVFDGKLVVLIEKLMMMRMIMKERRAYKQRADEIYTYHPHR